MAKKTIDELLDALETVQDLKIVVAKHDAVIETILDRLDKIERQLANRATPARQ